MLCSQTQTAKLWSNIDPTWVALPLPAVLQGAGNLQVDSHQAQFVSEQAPFQEFDGRSAEDDGLNDETHG